ncbi:type II toxin-antitoxin system RelE/ParE family toxin [Parabacteroides sp. PF5-6]|uniref:type II toxin-antitoxin system RelE/ParE family toxin n=1 Tax=Parabacteroides sp. PF5-6 TaxID=1742403 RepID=UPI0024073655|nr:type II toxin-antitoxin system RelE/ParE family toxin [Parabacteroides sp. PF5-6]MDF9829403.1 plasmid stabilization system protein ParE [Parabacteroides sp. PF5-6]
MARRIIWTKDAKSTLHETLSYYRTRNGNSKYSRKLYDAFKKDLLLVAQSPTIGGKTEKENIRYIIPHPDYMLFYQYDGKKVEVLVLWDCRQDPQKLKSYFIKTK